MSSRVASRCRAIATRARRCRATPTPTRATPTPTRATPTTRRAAKDLYAILGLRKEANPSAKDIKRAYHRKALELHPDKNVGDASAAGKFQTLQRVYGVLSDETKRRTYDATGRVEDAELGGEAFQNLYEYYRGAYKEVSTEDIEAFEREYRGSEEEKTRCAGALREVRGRHDAGVRVGDV